MTAAELIVVLKFLMDLAQTAPNPSSPPTKSVFPMPPSIGEVGESVLRCYHPTGRFHDVNVLEAPWSRQKDYNSEYSVLVEINWRGDVLRKPYKTRVALISRGGKLRGVIQGENSIVQYSRNCVLNDWVDAATASKN